MPYFAVCGRMTVFTVRAVARLPPPSLDFPVYNLEDEMIIIATINGHK